MKKELVCYLVVAATILFAIFISCERPMAKEFNSPIIPPAR